MHDMADRFNASAMASIYMIVNQRLSEFWPGRRQKDMGQPTEEEIHAWT
jgi:hypothetical protein